MNILEQIQDVRSKLEAINVILTGISDKTNEITNCMGLVGTETYNKILQFQSMLNTEAMTLQSMLNDLYTKLDQTRDALLGTPPSNTIAPEPSLANEQEDLEETKTMKDIMANPEMKNIIESSEEAKLSGIDTYVQDDLVEELQDLLDDSYEYPGMQSFVKPARDMIESLTNTTDSKALDKLIPEAMKIIEDIENMMDLCDKQNYDPSMGSIDLVEEVAARSTNPEDFLVVEDPKKSSTFHLQVKRNGVLDRNLCGAAWAALFSKNGFRGNKYSGPKISEAKRKLKQIYKKQGWAFPKES